MRNVLYAPGILVFRAVRKGKEGPVFNKAELLIAAAILVLAVIAVIRLADTRMPGAYKIMVKSR